VIANGDNLTIQRVKGIGAKTAQRIIIDLQDKMKKTVGILTPTVIGEHNTFKSEALSALLTLGFARLGAEKAIQQAIRNNESPASVEVLIKNALSYL
jgi:Holliday junction DNA helicase RuvA